MAGGAVKAMFWLGQAGQRGARSAGRAASLSRQPLACGPLTLQAAPAAADADER